MLSTMTQFVVGDLSPQTGRSVPINVSSTLNIKAGYKFIKLYQLLIYNDLIITQLKTKHLSCT
jgi:hypothetical protein